MTDFGWSQPTQDAQAEAGAQATPTPHWWNRATMVGGTEASGPPGAPGSSSAIAAKGYRSTTAISPDQLILYLSGAQSLDAIVAASPTANIATSRNASMYGIPYSGPHQSDTELRGTTVTVKDMLMSLTKLGKDEVIRLQQRLQESGYSGLDAQGQPLKMQWGVIDPATTKAYRNLIGDALLHPDKTLTDLLDDHGQTNMRDLTDKRNALRAQKLSQLDAKVSLTASDDLISAAQTAAEKAIGRDLKPDELSTFIDSFHADERTRQEKLINAQVSSASQLGVSDQQLNTFVDTVMSPSTGPGGLNGLGMTPQEWSRWADRVGMGPKTADTPENERAVAKEIALNFYAQHGSWSDVATAWYAGPGQHFKDIARVSAYYHGESPDLTPNINDMADRVTTAMRGATSTAASDMAATLTANATESQASPSAAAELMLQREHPVEYVGHEAAGRAADFFNLLAAGPTVNVAQHN